MVKEQTFMKKLLFATGGRKIHLNDLQILQDISNELLSFISARGNGNTPYLLAGCTITNTTSAGFYNIAAGLVFLNGKLLIIDAQQIFVPSTSIQTNPSVFITEGAPVTSSPKQYESGGTLDCVTETKAVFSNTPNGQSFAIYQTGPNSIAINAQGFWESLATTAQISVQLQALQTAIQTTLNNAIVSGDNNTLTSANNSINNKFALNWIVLVSSGSYNISYCKDAFGFVRFRGGLPAVNILIKEIVGILPTGFRPPNAISATDIGGNTVVVYSTGEVEITANIIPYPDGSSYPFAFESFPHY